MTTNKLLQFSGLDARYFAAAVDELQRVKPQRDLVLMLMEDQVVEYRYEADTAEELVEMLFKIYERAKKSKDEENDDLNVLCRVGYRCFLNDYGCRGEKKYERRLYEELKERFSAVEKRSGACVRAYESYSDSRDDFGGVLVKYSALAPWMERMRKFVEEQKRKAVDVIRTDVEAVYVNPKKVERVTWVWNVIKVYQRSGMIILEYPSVYAALVSYENLVDDVEFVIQPPVINVDVNVKQNVTVKQTVIVGNHNYVDDDAVVNQ